MPSNIDLSASSWILTGWTPYFWCLRRSQESDSNTLPEISAMSVRTPCSVQAALLKYHLIPDWRIALNARQIEWVENRHWIFFKEVILSDSIRREIYFERLDGIGCVLWDGKECGRFDNSYIPYHFKGDEDHDKNTI